MSRMDAASLTLRQKGQPCRFVHPSALKLLEGSLPLENGNRAVLQCVHPSTLNSSTLKLLGGLLASKIGIRAVLQCAHPSINTQVVGRLIGFATWE